MASPNISELATMAIESRTGELADNILDNNALLARLKRKGKVQTVSGGTSIRQELEYADNGTVQYYSGYETINISPSNTFTSADFTYAQIAAAVSISGLEDLQVSGSEQIIPLLSSRIRNAEKSLMNTVSVGIFSDGTGSGGKQIGGLQKLVSKTPTSGTVGGIDRATWTFWQNKESDPSGAPTSGNIQGRMNDLAVQLVRGTDSADLIVMDNNYYSTFLASMQLIQRITSEDQAGLGFTSLKYYGSGKAADVILDGGVGGACPANTAYFLNTDYIHFRPHARRNFVPIGGDRFATNQDAMVKLIGWAGNMTLSNASLQGVLFHS
jgi:hypothetical protein